jgi:hypothetical protein
MNGFDDLLGILNSFRDNENQLRHVIHCRVTGKDQTTDSDVYSKAKAVGEAFLRMGKQLCAAGGTTNMSLAGGVAQSDADAAADFMGEPIGGER